MGEEQQQCRNSDCSLVTLYRGESECGKGGEQEGNSDECQRDFSCTFKVFLVHHSHHWNVTAGCAASSLFLGSNGAARKAVGRHQLLAVLLALNVLPVSWHGNNL